MNHLIEECNCNPGRRGNFTATSQLSVPVPHGGCFVSPNGGPSLYQNNNGSRDNMMECEERGAMNPVKRFSAFYLTFDQSALEFDEETDLDRILNDLDAAIHQIQAEIGNTSNPDLEAYKVAREQDSTYVTNPNFIISFLRADGYNPGKAAWRMFRHLKIKRELFGDEKLARDILLDDLGEEGKKYMALGTLQVLPMPDDDGRRVIFGTTVLDSSASEIQKEAAIKVYFYFLAYAIEHVDDSIQKKGIVLLNWRVHNPPFPNAALLGPVSQIWRCIPMRVVAVHTCYAPITAITFSAFQLFGKLVAAWSSNQLVINHSHCGTATEVEYELRTKHNIPTDRFPYNKQAADIIHNHYHKVWMNRRNAIDQKKAQLYVSSRRSSVSVTQVLQSLRTSDQSIGIDFWNDSIGFSMVSDDESMIGSYHTNGDSNNEECMNISISSNDTFGDGSLESTENMFVGNDSCALGNGQLVNESDSDDIKLGRGKALQRHPGNIWLKALVSKEYEKYDSLDRNEQTKYATAL
eukprot:CAMPEP_0116133220 /NCGR_PEP_ID=MMETSP0329-20121206/9988_1 /TAXON_ID=697910 /ORGANISM="Pseudo-nitzschia arenysensis, Strain B593" /LENGTH=520 /DNA_ID=CAMNT_0003627833 /DNA_START=87 /DNA_END=1645 /DNA_ORIENTATION=+